MGDAENALPPSKKRAAGRELSRDTPIDDDDEDTPELDAGTFKRASDDVLATRRIVKVRRQQTNSAPSSNPFAGIRLVTPTESSAKPTEAITEIQLAGKNTTADDSKGSGDSTVDSEKAKDEETKQPESKTREVEDKTVANKDAAEESNAEKENLEVNNEESKDGNKIGNENKKDAADKENAGELAKESPKEEKGTENDDKKDDSENKDKVDNKASEEPSAEGDSVNSFQKLFSSQNAFTGFAGSGLSSSSFSFGTISNEGSGFGSGSGSIFGIKNDKPDGSGFGSGSGPKFGLGLSNSGNSIFGTSGATAVSKSDGSRLSTLKEVVIETGEENEKVVFLADSVLFEFVDGGWKERGKGELKVNETSGTEKKARLLMRSKGNYRLILNARLYPEMKLTDMEKKGVTFACINSATEGKDSLSTFALKFKDGSIVEEFKAAITAHKVFVLVELGEIEVLSSMGDAENALPPSKKRAAGRELSRDTPFDDDEEDTPELDAGTFKRASDDVLATRRIVKVRRQQTNSAPSSNPFAGIRLVTPTESSAKPTEAITETQLAGKNTTADDSKGSGDSTVDSEKAKDEETKQPESKTREVEDKTVANKDAAEESNAEKENLEVNNEESKDGNKIGNENKKDAADKENAGEHAKESPKEEKGTENDDKKDDSENKDKVDNKASEEPSAEGDSVNSFQKLFSSQNAFTGFAGSGLSSSSFSFGTISNEGSGFGSGSGSIFGIKNDKPDGSGFGSGSGPKFGLGLSNSGNSIFGTSGATAVSKSDGSRLSTLKEVVIETGEENEKVVFLADSVLFEFVDGGWKERGKGELKVNETSGTEKKARLLMRSKGNYRLILNARLYPEMKLTDMEKKGVTFACINSATEGKDSLSTFALKFKDGSIVEEFKAAITAHKGETLKTPES